MRELDEKLRTEDCEVTEGDEDDRGDSDSGQGYEGVATQTNCGCGSAWNPHRAFPVVDMNEMVGVRGGAVNRTKDTVSDIKNAASPILSPLF